MLAADSRPWGDVFRGREDAGTMLSVDRELFEHQGFLIFPEFKSARDIAVLRSRASAIVDAFDPSEAISIFTTRDQAAKSDDYFLDSAEKIRCFFEEGAFDADHQLIKPKSLAINKIGHAMHDLDSVFERFSRDPRLAHIAAELQVRDPLLYQSMYIFKQPNIGGEVAWHQDAAFFVTDPVSVITFWFALEAADRSNGCLWVQPGGHRSPLRNQFVVRGRIAALRELDAAPWPTTADARALEVAPGTLVAFHGMLPHYSAPNRSPKSRHAYTLHAVSGTARYSPENWLQRTAALPVRGF